MKAEEYEQICKAVDNTHIEIALTDNSTFLKRVPTTTYEKLALRLALKSRFSDIFKNPTLDKLEKEFLTMKAKIEKEKAEKKRIEREKWLKETNRPINRLVRLLRNRYHIVEPQFLDDWLNETTSEEKVQAYEEYKQLLRTRALPFDSETASFGLNFLQNALAHSQNVQRQRRDNSWIRKMLKK